MDKMIKNTAFLIVLYAIFSFSAPSMAETMKIQPLSESDVRLFINRLNEQGIIAGFDKNVKKDEIFGYDEQYGFGIADTAAGWFLYKADINNDKEDEYVLASSQGSGCFFDVEAIYKEKDGKFSDIYEEIKIPMRRLIRESEKATYDLEEGYAGFMNGSINIENIDGIIYFTLRQVRRDYGIDDYQKSFQEPESWKFIWNNNGVNLVDKRLPNK